MIRSVAYSQNLLVDDNLVEKLVSSSHINNGDTVLEIGAGKGIITKQLLKRQVMLWFLKLIKNL